MSECARCKKYPSSGRFYSGYGTEPNSTVSVCWNCLTPFEVQHMKDKRIAEITESKYVQFFALENRITKLEESVNSDTKWLPQIHFHKDRYPVVERLNLNKGRLEVLLEWKEDIKKNLNKLKGDY